MIKLKNKHKNNLLKLCLAFFLPFSLIGGFSLLNVSHAVNTADYVYYYEENISITNSSFTQGSTPYASGNSLNGWNAIESDSKATGMIIDVGSGSNSNPDDSSTTSFSKHQDTYMLKNNPGSKGNDSRILMINSKSSLNNTQQARKGYRSNEITLEANSFYRFSVSVKTSLNGEDNANASIYVSGLVDNDGKTFQIGYENLTNSIWKDFYIYIATGNLSQTVTVDLYLGSANGARSSGAVFFDEVYLNRYSENAFFELCEEADYVSDNYKSFNEKNVFLIKDLQNEKSLVDVSDYNFDFEDEITPDTNTLGENWSIISKSNAHAIISKIRNMQPADFKVLTGYSYIGDDLSYNNTQALILYTGNNQDYSSGYVGIQSKDIEIKAHTVYKVSLKLKLAEISEGSFYLQVKENDNIYTLYPSLLSNDEDAKNYYSLQSGKTSGITSNVENNFTNDYQTIELFIKGHSLYNTSVNLQLWLGDSETVANGCVIVDNIQIEYSTNSDFTSASNQVEFSSFSSEPSTINNGYFNATEIDNTESKYPLPATSWTTNIEDEKKNETGVIYLYDDESYKNLYANNYEWAGIYPGSPVVTNNPIPNNVYMMYNKNNSYQSITSSSYSLSNASYYKLSFNYYNQNGFTDTNPSKIKIEIIDENGITLFSKDNISSINTWNEMNIYFHTAETVSHNIQIKIFFGEENNKVGGLVYLDNFVVSSSSESDFNLASENYKADLTDYYLNLNPNGEIGYDLTDSPAYNLSIGTIYDSNYSENSDLCAVAGVVKGNNNPYKEINPDLSIDDSNFLVISTRVASEASLISKFKLTLEADKYYKLTFDLATIFNEEAQNASTDDHECNYGVTINIDGFDSITNLVTSQQLKHYTIYFKCTESSTPTITLTLVSDCNKTLGTALFTHINPTTVEETEYNSATLSPSYEKTIFSVKQTESTETDEDTDNSEEDTSDNSGTSDNKWLLIPSIIMGVALLVALIGYILRHIKIKKIDKIKKEAYDRKLSVNHDVILMEAQKRRDIEINELQNAKKLLEDERINIDEEHKQFIKENKIQSNGKISKDVEKMFKKYNLNIAKIDEKINIIQEKIDNTMSAEYLLQLERKIVAEEEDKFKNKKDSKKSK